MSVPASTSKRSERPDEHSDTIRSVETGTELQTLDHFAIEVPDIAAAVDWYRSHFVCDIAYQDESWALLQFANVKLAFVLPGQHPPHLGFFVPDAERFGNLTPHRDGTRSVYVRDPAGNAVELLDRQST